MTTDSNACPEPARSPRFQRDRSDAETTEAFDRLFGFKGSFGPRPNKDILAVALTGACILEGFDKWYRLHGALRTLGIKQGHIDSILNGGTGDDPSRHHWWIDLDGSYRLHDRTIQ